MDWLLTLGSPTGLVYALANGTRQARPAVKRLKREWSREVLMMANMIVLEYYLLIRNECDGEKEVID